MKPTEIPTDKQGILRHPLLHNLPLSNPQLGGAVDIFFGNMNMDDYTYDGTIRCDRLKIIKSPFGWRITSPLQSNTSTQVLTTNAVPDLLQDDLAKL